jgi:hypothetical protein
LNQQGVSVNGATLKDQLMALAQKSDSHDLNIDVPASSLGQKFNFDGLASKPQEAISKKSEQSVNKSEPSADSLEAQARELVQNYIAINPKLQP